LNVDVGYLTQIDDVEALGAAARVAYEIKTSVDGLSAPQEPCSNPLDVNCVATSCPDLLQGYQNALVDQINSLFPAGSPQIPKFGPSTVFPNYLEPFIGLGYTDIQLGEALRYSIISPHHFAGTAGIGRVVDNTLKVIGVDALYVADASALPTTPRVNSMASTMMLGRLVGKNAF
jgi:choline dehydrogenase-like flavoprotein